MCSVTDGGTCAGLWDDDLGTDAVQTVLAAVQTLPGFGIPIQRQLWSHRDRFCTQGDDTALCSQHDGVIGPIRMLPAMLMLQQIKGAPGKGWMQRSLLYDIIRCCGLCVPPSTKTTTHLVIENPAAQSKKLDAARRYGQNPFRYLNTSARVAPQCVHQSRPARRLQRG